MKTSNSINISHLVKVLAALLVLNLSCGKTQTDPVSDNSTQCGDKTAQIQIGDGYSKILCGCAQSAAQIDPPSTLTCTISTGSTVHFIYSGSATTHQIISTQTPGFETSPISNSKDANRYLVHPAVFSTAGNFSFKDSFDERLQGTIQVR